MYSIASSIIGFLYKYKYGMPTVNSSQINVRIQNFEIRKVVITLAALLQVARSTVD